VNFFKISMPDEYIEKFEKINECEEFDNEKIYESMIVKKVEEEKNKRYI